MPTISRERIAQCKLAIANAKEVLKKGDRIKVSRFGGLKPTYTFEGWDGNWMQIGRASCRERV